MYKLSVETSFSAAHFLNDYEGPCSRIHGHNWKIQVTVASGQLDNSGMVIDFKDLKDLAWQVAGRFDHQMINKVSPFDRINPTAENLSKYLYHEIGRLLPPHIKMDTIRLWETDNYLLEYSADDE